MLLYVASEGREVGVSRRRWRSSAVEAGHLPRGLPSRVVVGVQAHAHAGPPVPRLAILTNYLRPVPPRLPTHPESYIYVVSEDGCTSEGRCGRASG